jgi:intein-encoded DNA endonuclease-like protein
MTNDYREIRKPRLKLVSIGTAFREQGSWRRFFGDSKGRVYLRSRRRGWREIWWYCMTICERKGSQ